MTDRLAELSAAGVAVWLDDISRERLATGGLDALRRDQHVVGVTSNPTIFANALADSDDYAEQMHDLALRRVAVEEAARMITTYDVRWACDVMRPAYDATSGVDGRVSIEVDPQLAHDTDRTVAEAKALWWLVDRPEPLHQDPGHRRRPARDHRDPGRRHQRQRDPHLRARPVRAGDGRLLPASSRPGPTATTCPGSARSPRSSCPEWTPRCDKRLETTRHAGGAGPARQGGHRQRAAGLPALRARLRHRPVAGAGRRRRAPAASTVGVDLDQEPGLPRRHVRRGARRARRRQHHAGGRRSTPSPTTARSSPAWSSRRTRRPRACSTSWPRSGIDYDDVIATLEREGVEKFEASALELLKSVETQLGGSA